MLFLCSSRAARLAAFAHEHNVAILRGGVVYEGAEALEFFWVVNGGLPLALVGGSFAAQTLPPALSCR